MDTIKILFPTNINGKLNCTKFIHIADAPEKPVQQKVLDESIIEILTDDLSMPPTHWKLRHVQQMPLDTLGSWSTWASHGMDMADFWKHFRELGYTGYSPMAIYYYEKYSS